MKKNLKVALYNPYLDTLGGGEKHILSIIDVFVENGADATVFWDEDLSKDLERRFPIKCIKKLKWTPKKLLSSSLKALQALNAFDYFFYVTNGSYFFSPAKKNFVFCMVPDKKLYNLNLLNRLKLWNYRFISNSPYTTKWLMKWDINPITIPPYIDDKLFSNNKNEKEKIVLSVGRFFPHLHSKNQEKIIKVFKNLRKSNHIFKDFKLVLVGGLKNEDRPYFEDLKKLSENDSSIVLKPNVSQNELYNYYQISSYFWHFTGLEVNEEEHPEMVEHFGIAPLEAIASGCLTFCHSSGGPREIIKSDETGFLFSDESDLIKKMVTIEKNDELKTNITNNGETLIKENYNYEVFKKNVLKIL